MCENVRSPRLTLSYLSPEINQLILPHQVDLREVRQVRSGGVGE